MTVHKGVYYFERRESAERYADAIGASRVLRYQYGYAVQYHVSGAYAGVTQPIGHAKCAWCPDRAI